MTGNSYRDTNWLWRLAIANPWSHQIDQHKKEGTKRFVATGWMHKPQASRASVHLDLGSWLKNPWSRIRDLRHMIQGMNTGCLVEDPWSRMPEQGSLTHDLDPTTDMEKKWMSTNTQGQQPQTHVEIHENGSNRNSNEVQISEDDTQINVNVRSCVNETSIDEHEASWRCHITDINNHKPLQL